MAEMDYLALPPLLIGSDLIIDIQPSGLPLNGLSAISATTGLWRAGAWLLPA